MYIYIYLGFGVPTKAYNTHDILKFNSDKNRNKYSRNLSSSGFSMTGPFDGGAGFTSLPTISINTETGFNAILKPIMKFSKPEEIDTPEGTNVIQVVDCVGKVV